MTHFGGPVPYTPATGGPAFDVVGVWSEPHEAIEIQGGETEVSTQAPRLGIDLPDFLARKVAAGHPATAPGERDTFVRAGVTWRVIDVQPDSEGGGLDLIVHRA